MPTAVSHKCNIVAVRLNGNIQSEYTVAKKHMAVVNAMQIVLG